MVMYIEAHKIRIFTDLEHGIIFPIVNMKALVESEQ